jgi:DNA-binding IclR family transcriptional regulator
MSGFNTSRTVKTADTVFEIVTALQELDGSTITELADYLGLAKSTVHTYLATLEQKEYVVKDGKTYDLSLKFLDHGTYSKQKNELTSVAHPILKRTAEETGEVVWLIVEEHGRAVYLDRAKGDRAVQTNGRRGLRTSLHFVAAGKCILANLDEEDVHQILDRHGLPEQTDNTITERRTLLNELQEVRDQGYAYNAGEEVKGVHAVGAPIKQDGTVYGGVSIAGPSARFQDEDYDQKMRKAIVETANTIELNLEY